MGIIFKTNVFLQYELLKKLQMNKLFSLILFFFGIAQNELIGQEIQKKTTEQKTIIVYGSDECHHCIETKAFLKEKKIDFIFYDIDKNPEALKEVLIKLKNANISTSNLGIPVVDKYGVLYTNNGDFQEFLKKLE